jgi:CRISPR-associated protein Csb3
MNNCQSDIRVNVDVTNPGQFFACCGLLELAHRLWRGTEGWFEGDQFMIIASNTSNASLVQLVCHLHDVSIASDDTEADPKTCPLRLDSPFNLRLDWWLDANDGDRLKTWAGQQSISRVAPAMKLAIACDNINSDIYQASVVVTDPADRKKPVEPFYFDARRFAHALDTGFSLDVQNAETLAHPVVELLCLIGLQRCRPTATTDKWVFEYHVWQTPLSAALTPAAVSGRVSAGVAYLFRLLFRDDQKRYKAFSFATPIGD